MKESTRITQTYPNVSKNQHYNSINSTEDDDSEYNHTITTQYNAPSYSSFNHNNNNTNTNTSNNGNSTQSHSNNTTNDNNGLNAYQAYRAGDVRASKLFHQRLYSTDYEEAEETREAHNAGGKFSSHLKAMVYGGVDGIITTFATVTSVAGGGLAASVVLILGMSHLFADGISMGTGDAMSTQAENDYNISERKREKWEMENNMEGEIDEMVALYMKKGFRREDAITIITTLSKYEDAFLDHMMVEELGLMPMGADESPIKSGMVTMLSFVLFGSIPLLPYLIALLPGLKWAPDVQLIISIIATVITLFILGAVKGSLVEKNMATRWWWSGFLMALNGTLAAVVGYAIGYGMQQLIVDANVPIDV